MDDLDDLDRKNLRTNLGGEMVLDIFVKLGQTKVRQNIVVNGENSDGSALRGLTLLVRRRCGLSQLQDNTCPSLKS
jgi:hypothetical protein